MFDNIIKIFPFVSFGLNLIFLIVWLRNRVLLRYFLVGCWEGEVIHENENAFECILMVTTRNDRDNAALFYYEAREINDAEIFLKGLDKLTDYDDNYLFVFNRRWQAKFVRKVSKESQTRQRGNIPPHYEWTCNVKSLFFRPKMEVTINAEGRKFTGVLTKS